MLRRVTAYIRKHGLLDKGKPVLVGVSGGADSVALLDVLIRAGYICIAAHCNFQLRSAESERDETFVRSLCEQRKVALETIRFDTKIYARTHCVGIEVAARELRYRWFDEVARQHDCQAVAVAHHQNDQAETVLLNLKRGTGLRGIAGMRPKSVNPIVPKGLPIIRPLLCTTHDYIEHYLRDIRGIEWVTDSTNSDTTISRNAIREQLKSYTKAEIEHIAQTATFMQGYVDIIEGKDTREAEIARLYEHLRECGFAEIEKIYEALQRGEGGKTFRSKTHLATIKKKQLCVTSV